ncbi:hypothetical protein [Neorhodopirellula lusitana]|uniref:hypothetical protein n=1 Tax=Neorhodopirellula lusitana TaxID=445327 RepID=UPI00385073B9
MPSHTGHDARHAEFPAAKPTVATARCRRPLWAGCPHALRRERSDRLSLASERQREGEANHSGFAEGTASTDDRRGMGRRGMDAAVAQGMEADQWERVKCDE